MKMGLLKKIAARFNLTEDQDIAEIAFNDIKKDKINAISKIQSDYEKFMEKYKNKKPLLALCCEIQEKTGKNSIHFDKPILAEIIYYDANKKTTKREIDIISVKSDYDEDSIYAFCHLRNKLRTFKVVRIQEVVVEGKKVDIIKHIIYAYKMQESLKQK
jgi:hypothetical protein